MNDLPLGHHIDQTQQFRKAFMFAALGGFNAWSQLFKEDVPWQEMMHYILFYFNISNNLILFVRVHFEGLSYVLYNGSEQ